MERWREAQEPISPILDPGFHIWIIYTQLLHWVCCVR